MSATVKTTIEAAKDALVGTEQGPSITSESRRTFERFAVKDDSGSYMTPEGFVNALTNSNMDGDFHKITREQYAILFPAAGKWFLDSLDMGVAHGV